MFTCCCDHQICVTDEKNSRKWALRKAKAGGYSSGVADIDRLFAVHQGTEWRTNEEMSNRMSGL